MLLGCLFNPQLIEVCLQQDALPARGDYSILWPVDATCWTGSSGTRRLCLVLGGQGGGAGLLETTWSRLELYHPDWRLISTPGVHIISMILAYCTGHQWTDCVVVAAGRNAGVTQCSLYDRDRVFVLIEASSISPHPPPIVFLQTISLSASNRRVLSQVGMAWGWWVELVQHWTRARWSKPVLFW